jgi:hypothetical protein
MMMMMMMMIKIIAYYKNNNNNNSLGRHYLSCPNSPSGGRVTINN